MLPLLESNNFFEGIYKPVRYLSNYASSVIHNKTSNSAEEFMSIVAKFIGGKRVFFGAGGDYNARLHSAVIQSNSLQVLSETHEKLYDSAPDVVVNLEKKRQIDLLRKNLSRANSA